MSCFWSLLVIAQHAVYYDFLTVAVQLVGAIAGNYG